MTKDFLDPTIFGDQQFVWSQIVFLHWIVFTSILFGTLFFGHYISWTKLFLDLKFLDPIFLDSKLFWTLLDSKFLDPKFVWTKFFTCLQFIRNQNFVFKLFANLKCRFLGATTNTSSSTTGCPTKPYSGCILIIMNCKIIQIYYKTIHFKVDILRTKTSIHSFLGNE